VTEEQAPWRPSCGPPQTTTTEYSFADMEANEPITRNRTAAFEERLSRFSRLRQGLSLCKQWPRRETLQRPALDRYRIALLIGVLSHGSWNKKTEFPIRNA